MRYHELFPEVPPKLTLWVISLFGEDTRTLNECLSFLEDQPNEQLLDETKWEGYIDYFFSRRDMTCASGNDTYSNYISHKEENNYIRKYSGSSQSKVITNSKPGKTNMSPGLSPKYSNAIKSRNKSRNDTSSITKSRSSSLPTEPYLEMVWPVLKQRVKDLALHDMLLSYQVEEFDSWLKALYNSLFNPDINIDVFLNVLFTTFIEVEGEVSNVDMYLLKLDLTRKNKDAGEGESESIGTEIIKHHGGSLSHTLNVLTEYYSLDESEKTDLRDMLVRVRKEIGVTDDTFSEDACWSLFEGLVLLGYFDALSEKCHAEMPCLPIFSRIPLSDANSVGVSYDTTSKHNNEDMWEKWRVYMSSFNCLFRWPPKEPIRHRFSLETSHCSVGHRNAGIQPDCLPPYMLPFRNGEHVQNHQCRSVVVDVHGLSRLLAHTCVEKWSMWACNNSETTQITLVTGYGSTSNKTSKIIIDVPKQLEDLRIERGFNIRWRFHPVQRGVIAIQSN